MKDIPTYPLPIKNPAVGRLARLLQRSQAKDYRFLLSAQIVELMAPSWRRARSAKRSRVRRGLRRMARRLVYARATAKCILGQLHRQWFLYRADIPFHTDPNQQRGGCLRLEGIDECSED